MGRIEFGASVRSGSLFGVRPNRFDLSCVKKPRPAR